MSLKQIKWHAAVLTVAVIAALTVLFALATVTSNAADASYDPATRTYTMSDSTYDQKIDLDPGTTTTISISGYNKLIYGDSSYANSCIYGSGALKIIGTGTLEVPNSQIFCGNFTVGDGVKLLMGDGLHANGYITVGKAEIGSCSESAYLQFSTNNSAQSPGIVFNNSTLKISMSLTGETVLTNCNVMLEDQMINSNGAPFTIDGGTFNVTMSGTGQFMPGAMNIGVRAVIKNAVIKTNSYCNFTNLEMTNSTFENTIPVGEDGAFAPAIWGDNLVIVGSKVKAEGNALAGIVAFKQLIITGGSEVDLKGLYFGAVGEKVTITNSSGTFQMTDAKGTAGLAACTAGFDGSTAPIPGELSLNNVYVTEPTDYTKGDIRTSVVNGAISNTSEATIKTILDGQSPAKKVVIKAEHKTHTWDEGKVTKEPTETAEGVRTYTCTVCGETKTEAIPKLTPKGSAAGADGTPFGKGASVAAAEAAILALPNDNDPAGTAFSLIQLKASKVTKNSINLKWKAVPGATKYILFANKCGTGNKYKKLGEVTGTSYTATQAAGAAIQKGTYYKFIMIAADASGKVVSTSKTVHAATKGGKIGNHKKVTVKKAVTKKAKKLKVGKTLKLKAKAVPQAKKLKVRKHRGIMYESSNPAVAQVNGKGTVKGVGKGTCYIYAYAQNGTCAKVKVTVK